MGKSDKLLVTVDLLTIGGSNLNAFAGIGGGYDTSGNLNSGAMGLTLSGVEFGLALASEQLTGLEPAGYQLRKWTTLEATAGSVGFVGLGSDLTISATNVGVAINQAGKLNDAVVDYRTGKTALSVATGTGTSMALTLDGRKGELLQASGMLNIDVYGFVSLRGNLAVSKSSGMVTLADLASTTTVNESLTPVAVNVLTIGGSGLNAFAGIDGGYDASGTLKSGAMGLSLGSVDFGLALMTSSADVTRKWTTLEATAGSVGFVGLGSDLTISATNVRVAINQAGKLNDAVVDYRTGKTALSVAKGTGSSIALTLDGSKGELLQASGALVLDVYGFVRASGTFAIEKSSTNVILAKKTGETQGETVAVNLLKFGGSSVTVFAGVSAGTSDAIGLSLDNIDFGLALMTSQADSSRKWTTLSADASSVGFVGLDDFLPTIRNISVDVNQATRVGDQVVDFAAKNLLINTGTGTSVTFNLPGSKGELIRAEGDVTLKMLDFAYFKGTIGFEKYTPAAPLTLKSNTGSLSTVSATSMMAITGSNITAFVGYADSGFDSGKTLAEQASNLYGFGVTDVDFGVVKTKAGGKSYTAVKANMASAALYGFDSDVFNLSVTGLSFAYASSDSSGSVIDYKTSFGGGLSLGSTGSTVIDFSSSRFGVYAQQATLSISKFLYFSGAIGFEKADCGDTLKAGIIPTSVLGAKGFSIGGSNITAFVGYAENGIDKTKTLAAQSSSLYGFGVDGLDFGLLSLKDSSGTSYRALKAHADNMTVYGFDPSDFKLSASNLNIEYNSASIAGRELNFTAFGSGSKQVATGGSPVTLDFKGSRIGVFAGQVTLRISQFLYVQGSIGFQKADFGTLLAGVMPVLNARGFTIGGTDIDVFVGYASSDFDFTKSFAEQTSKLYGFGAEGIDFGLIQVKGDTGIKYTAAKAHADKVALYGFDPEDFQLSLSGIDFKVNTASIGSALNLKTSFPLTGMGAGYQLPTGGTPVLLDMTGTTIGASLNNATLRISDFVYVSGSFAFEKGGTQTLSAKTVGGISVPVLADAFTIGASHVQAFVGVGGPYRTDSNKDGKITTADAIANPDAIGLVIDDFSFGLGLFRDKVLGTKFTALKAEASTIGFVGFGEVFKFTLQDVQVAVNTSNNSLFVLDFTKSAGGGLSIPTGDVANPVVLDFSDKFIQATVGHATAKVAGILLLEGGFTFQKSTIDKMGFHGFGMNLEVGADALIVAGQNVQAFAGFNGPYRTDSNNDGKIDDSDSTNSKAIGFAISDLDFALVMVSPTLGGGITLPLNFFGLSATAAYAGLVGTDPYLTLNAQNVVFEFNGAIASGILLPSVYADFSGINGGKGLDIQIGSNATAMNMSFDSNFLRVGITGELGIFDLFTIKPPRLDFKFELPEIDFGIGFSLKDIGLSDFKMPDLPTFDANMLLPSIGLSNLTDLLADVGVSTPDWLKSGLKYLKNVDIRIGIAGVTGSITLTDLKINLGGFVHLEGDFKLTLGQTFKADLATGINPLVSSVVKLAVDAIYPGGLEKLAGLFDISDDLSTIHDVTFKGLSFGASNVNMFIGLGDPDFSSSLSQQSGLFGFGLENLDLAIGLFKADLPSWVGAKNVFSFTVHAGELGVYGFGDVLKITAKDVTVDVNSGGNTRFMAGDKPLMTALPIYSSIKNTDGTKGLKISTGGTPVLLTFGGNEVIGLNIGVADIAVADFLYLHGSLAFRKGDRFDVEVDLGGFKKIVNQVWGAISGEVPGIDTFPLQVEAFTIAGSHLTGFAGIDGPYRYGDDVTGTIKEGVPDGLQDNINNSAKGVVIDDVSFAFGMFSPTVLSFLPDSLQKYVPKFFTVKASVGTAGLVGIDKDILEVTAKDIEVNINQFYWQLPEKRLELAVNAAIQLFGAPTINWKKSFPDSPEDRNKNKILDLYNEDKNSNGILDPGEDLNNDKILDLSEDLNKDSKLAAYGYAVPAGGNNAVIFDIEGALIQVKIGYVEVNLAGFLQLSGSMAMTMRGGEKVTLSNGEVTTVQTLALGINDANGFIGVPSGGHGYFYDSNGDGRINSSDEVNKDATGLVLQNLDVGVLVAAEIGIGLDGVTIGTYLAAKANLDKIGLNNVPNVVLNARDLKLDINFGMRFKLTTGFTVDEETRAVSYNTDNLGVSVFPTTIDFSKSTWTRPSEDLNSNSILDPGEDRGNGVLDPGEDKDNDGKLDPGEDQGDGILDPETKMKGYGIETGDSFMPVVLTYTDLYLRVAGQAELAVYIDDKDESSRIIDITGAFEIKAAKTGLSIFVDVQAKIGKEGVLVLEAHAQGLLVLGEYEDKTTHETSIGIAIKLDLSTSFNIGSVLSSSIKLNFAMNSFGKDVVYDVPEDFWKENGGVLDYHTVVISATPPNKLKPANFYVSLVGKGEFKLMDILSFNGDISVLFSVTDGNQVLAELSIGATVVSPVLKLGAVGTLAFSSNGFYGSLHVTGLGKDESIIGIDNIFSIGGSFLLQINTTKNDERVLELEKINGVYTGKMITPMPDQPANLPKESFHISGKVDVSIVGVLELKGSVDILINKDGFQASLDVSLDLGFIGKVAVTGAASILSTDEGPVFALKATLSVHLGIDIINLDAGATLEINTSKTKEYSGVPANTMFKLALHGAQDPKTKEWGEFGSVTVLALKGTFSGEISIQDGLFKLELSATLKIGSLLKLDMGLKVHSDGYFYLHAGVDLDLDLAIIRLQVGASLTISSDPLFEFSIYGSLSVHIDLGFFEINETLAGFSGLIRINASSAHLAASVTLMGMTVSGDMLWSWGKPPVIATQVGDVLYLNMGDRAQGDDNWRDTDVNYQKIKNETYSISEKDGVTTVRALGVTSKYTGVKKIIADGGEGNDCIVTDPGVTSELDFHGGSGSDVFVISGGAATSVIYGDADDDLLTGGGASGIHYYGGAGNDKFIGSETAEYIDMGADDNSVLGGGGDDTIYVGSGKNTVDAGAGNDRIYVGNGKNTVDAGSGNDLIYVSTPATVGALTVTGGTGEDRVILDPITSISALKMNEHQFRYDKLTVNFDDSLEGMLVTDTATKTTITTDLAAGGNWGFTDLTLISSGIADVSDATFLLPEAHLTLVSQGLVGTIKGEMQDLTVVNSGEGDITVIEANDLNIVSTDIANGGLYAAKGDVSVTLLANESLLSLESGVIHSGGNITILADDIDCKSGHDRVSAAGQLTIQANSLDQNYKIGAAGGSKYGVDYSLGKNEGFMDLSMRDMDAFADGFSEINIGHDNDQHSVVMYIGDVEDRQMGAELPVFYAMLTDKAHFTAGRINIVGDVQSSDVIGFTGRLSEVWKANYHDQLGAADSGVLAKEVLFDLTEQIVVSGWIIGEEKVTINVHGSTGENVIVGYGAEPNSVTADMGSAVYTTNSNSIVTIDASASVIIATQLEAGFVTEEQLNAGASYKTGTTVTVNAGTGLTVLEGAAVVVRGANSVIDMNARSYVHINSGGAVTSGARFDWVGTTPVAVKTGDNASISIIAAGEMKLSGSLTSAGAMNLVGGGSDAANSYASYFDTINGQTITTVTDAMTEIIAKLNSGLVDSAIIAALTTQHYSLAAGAAVSSISNYTPFSSLTKEQQAIVAAKLGYEVKTIDETTSAYYYKADAAAGKQLLTTFTEGGYTGSLAGYTRYEGMVYYNPSTNSIKTGFVEGDPVDYDNTLIWGVVEGATKSATFEGLSDADKERVATVLGYTKDMPSPEFTTNDFEDVSLKNFCNALKSALGVTFSVDTNTDIKLSDPNYVALTDAQSGTLVKEINALLLHTDLYDLLTAKMPTQVVTADLSALKLRYETSHTESDLKYFNRAALAEFLPIYTPEMPVNLGRYFNYNAPAGKKSVTTFVQGTWTDYKTDDMYWGTATAGDMTVVAHALGYDVYAGGAWFKADAADGKRIITTVAEAGASPDYWIEDINWGGVAAPADDATFEQLTIGQKQVVLNLLGYTEYQGDIYYNTNTKALVSTVTYTVSGVTWDTVAKPVDGTAFDKLTQQQQAKVLTSTNYQAYTGTVYYSAEAVVGKQYALTFEQGTGKDYQNSAVNWSSIPVPASGAVFGDMTAEEKAAYSTMSAEEKQVLDTKYLTADQQNAIVKNLGYIRYNQAFYFDSDATDADQRLVTTFTEGIDYTNSAMDWGTAKAVDTNRWVLDDGTNKYVVYALDSDDDGTVDEILIQKPHELLGQRGFGYLLTGTVTSLQDNCTMVISSHDDTIIRGNINLYGNNSDLTIQSDTWVYFEGKASVTNDFSILGGVSLTTGLTTATAKETSVYVHSTATLKTWEAGSVLTVKGGKDVDIYGRTVAGGDIGSNGIEWAAGGNSEVAITAGQQVLIDSAVAASKEVRIVTTGVGSDGWGLVLTTSGGITTAGITSDNSGGLITIDTVGGVTLSGMLLSGGSVKQTFNEKGELLTESYSWSQEKSTIAIATDDQLWLGGMARSSIGEMVEIGAVIRASEAISLVGGVSSRNVVLNGTEYYDDRSLRMPGGAKVAVSNADGSIYLEALGDAEVYGLLVAGGEVVDYRDSTGFYLGSRVETFGGASSVTINAERGHQIRIGRDLYAGSLIDLRGGIDPILAEDTVIDPVTGLAANPWAGQGVVLAGTTHLATWQANSRINLSAKGDLSVLAPAWRQELTADGFAEFADGHISSDATLVISLDKGMGFQDYTITIKASDTTDNFGVDDLAADIQTVLDTAIGKDGDGYSYLNARLTDGRLMFTSPRATEFSIKTSSTNYGLLGFTQLSTGAALSGRIYAIDAGESGSTVNIGKEGSFNGQILVANAIRGAKAINLYSGTKGDGSQNFTLTETGVFETLEGGIILNPGDNGVVLGDLVARGAGANIVITSKDTLELRGNLTAQRNIFITAGTDINAGERSIYTYGTSHFTTLDADGTIKITGLNDVVINSQIGQLANQLRLLQITSTEGTLAIDSESGYIATGAEFKLTGNTIDIAGVVKSTRLTPALFDNEVSIDTTGAVTIHGELTFAGSLLINAGEDITLYNTTLATGADQRLTIKTPGNLLLGNAAAVTGTTAVSISADKLVDIEAGGLVDVASDALIFSNGKDSRIKITAAEMSVEGAVRAGAVYDKTAGYLWNGANGMVEIITSGALNIGGTDGGGTVASSGTVLITNGKDSTGMGLSLTATSTIMVDATGGGTFAASSTGLLRMGAGGDVKLYGTVESMDAGSDIVISSDSLVLVDGLVKASDDLTITGGTDTTGIGIYLTPMVFSTSDSTNRVSGGTLDTASSGTIHLKAIDNIYLSGVVGQLDNSGKANVSQIDSTSTSKSITVDGTVDIGDSVTVIATDVNVLAGGRIFARNAASAIFVKATGNVWVYPGATVPPPYAAQLKANGLLHILASNIRIDGMISNDSGSTGQILLNAATNITITGTVSSYGDITINSGVKLDDALATLTGLRDKTTLQSSGTVYVIASGLLDATGNISIKAGGDIIINADATVGGLTTILNPVITTVTQEVTKVSGYKQVFAGSIKVDEVSWKTSLLVEQIGTAKVVVGHKNFAMDVVLEQIGYYNPNAAEGSKFREVLIEGIDYRNMTGEAGTGPIVDWSRAGSDALPTRTAEAVVGDYKATAYKEFTALNDAQKQAVLNATGYMPLFQFSYGASKKDANGNITAHADNKVLLEQTINGTPSDNFVTPDWASNPEVIYRVEVDGWKDKYIKMPKGANEDILRVVSQGEGQYLTGDTTADGANNGSWGSAAAAGVQYISGATVKTSFTPGTDYRTTDTFWATYGAEKPSATATWSQLSAAQQEAVASNLGYSVKYDNTKGEYIGQYRDIGVADYTQAQSYYSKTDSLPPVVTQLNVSGYSFTTNGMTFSVKNPVSLLTVDKMGTVSSVTDDGAARWEVTYENVSGYRQFNVENQLVLVGGSTIQSDRTTGNTFKLRAPNWSWGLSGTQTGVDSGKVNAGTNDTGDIFTNTRPRTQNISAPGDYISALTNDTASLVQKSTSQRTGVDAASFSYPAGDFTELIKIYLDDDDGSTLPKGYHEEEDLIKFEHDWLTMTIAPTTDNTDWYWLNMVGTSTDLADSDVLINKMKATWDNLNTIWTTYAKNGGEVQVKLDYVCGSEAQNGSGGDDFLVGVRARLGKTGTILETQNDYTYNWTSEWHNMYDTRIKLGYELTTQSVDIYDYRPIYGSSALQARTVTQQDVNLWDTQAQTSTETISTTVRTTEEPNARQVGNYSVWSLKGSTILLDSNKNSTISALVTATNTLAFTAANTLTIKGSTGTTTENGSTVTVEMLSSLIAAHNVTLTAGSNLVLADSALVKTTAEGSDITLASKQDMTLAGQTVSQDTITIAAARDIILSGTVTTLNTITVTSGATVFGAVTLGTVKDGSITGDIEASLTVTASTGDIVLTAGILGGDITLVNSGLSAPDTVTLTASAGKITNTQGVITTAALIADAASGISVNTSVSSVDLATTDAGNISITNAKALLMTSVSATDGAVTVSAVGDVTATSITTLGTTDRNDIIINTFKVGTGTADVSLLSVVAGGKGDLAINAQGRITQLSSSLVADVLSVTALGGALLTTNVATLSVTTKAIGNVVVNQTGAQQLTVESVTVMDGSFTLISAGTVDLASVVLSSNSADNDITVTTMAGDILVRYINAGIYLENGVSPGTVYNSDGTVLSVSAVSSAGDIVLTAKGKIAESFTDDAVDLVANTVSLAAGSGILGLEIAVNTVTKAETTSGDIWLKDCDGYLEDPLSRGLTVLSVKTATGGTSTVTIGAVNDLFVVASSIVMGDTIKLVSDAGNVQVAKPASGDSLVYTRGVSFNAKKVLDLYRFFNATDLIEYRAGDYFEFNKPDGSVDVHGNPNKTKVILSGNLTANSIIIDTGDTLSIDGTLTARDYLELNSARDVIVKGNIVAIGSEIGEVKIIARGEQNVTTVVDVNNSGNRTTVEKASGYVFIQTTGISASNFEIRAAQDIYIGLQSDFILSGFVGGLAGFDKAQNIKLAACRN